MTSDNVANVRYRYPPKNSGSLAGQCISILGAFIREEVDIPRGHKTKRFTERRFSGTETWVPIWVSVSVRPLSAVHVRPPHPFTQPLLYRPSQGHSCHFRPNGQGVRSGPFQCRIMGTHGLPGGRDSLWLAGNWPLGWHGVGCWTATYTSLWAPPVIDKWGLLFWQRETGPTGFWQTGLYFLLLTNMQAPAVIRKQAPAVTVKLALFFQFKGKQVLQVTDNQHSLVWLWQTASTSCNCGGNGLSFITYKQALLSLYWQACRSLQLWTTRLILSRSNHLLQVMDGISWDKLLWQICLISHWEQALQVNEVTDNQAPTVTDNQAPPVADNQAPPVADKQAPPVADNQAPPVADNQAPPVTDKQAPPVADKQAPPVTDNQAPPVTDKQAPPVTDKQATTVTDKQGPPFLHWRTGPTSLWQIGPTSNLPTCEHCHCLDSKSMAPFGALIGWWPCSVASSFLRPLIDCGDLVESRSESLWLRVDPLSAGEGPDGYIRSVPTPPYRCLRCPDEGWQAQVPPSGCGMN